jgi:hypothetical protein
MEAARQEACAHMRVRYTTQYQPDGLPTGWWECDSCGEYFVPIAHTRAVVEEKEAEVRANVLRNYAVDTA